MKDKTNSSLISRSKLSSLKEEDRAVQNNYLTAVMAFARLSYESVYVIDYEKMSFEYVSENPLFLCGYTPEEVIAMGYDFYFRQVPEADLELLHVLNEAGFDFFERIPVSEKWSYSISYDFHLRHEHGKQILVNHKLTPLLLTQSGKMWKAMCIVSVSHHQYRGNVVIHKQRSDECWKLDIQTKTWQKFLKPKLTERETEVLRLYARGLTINQIAEKLFVAPDTVKYYRRKIFEAFEVNSIVAALAYAVNNKII
jgi:DNA-binding CsgD family transcriptional regulator